jgi:hypothetical protein
MQLEANPMYALNQACIDIGKMMLFRLEQSKSIFHTTSPVMLSSLEK